MLKPAFHISALDKIALAAIIAVASTWIIPADKLWAQTTKPQLPQHSKPSRPTPQQITQCRQKVAYLTTVLNRDPKDSKALAERAAAYLTLSDLKHAGSDCERALALDPKLQAAGKVAYDLVEVYNGDMQEDNAIHFLTLTIGAFPSEGRLYTERAELLHAISRDKDALTDQNRAIILNPKDQSAYFSRAEVETELGDLRAAARDFGISAQYDKDPWRGYSNQAKCYEQLKDYRGAVAVLTKLITSKATYVPELLNARLYRAKDYVKLGDYKNAFADLNTVIDTPHTEAMKFESHNQMSAQCGALQERVALYITQKKLDLAIRDYDKLIAIDQQWGQNTPRYHEERAKLLRQTGQLAALAAGPVQTKATATTSDAVQTDGAPYVIEEIVSIPHKGKVFKPLPPDQQNEQAFYARGIKILATKNLASAKAWANLAIKEHPHWCAPYVLLGRVADATYVDEDAVSYYRKAAQVRPECVLPLRELAWSLHGATDYKGSLAVADNGLKLLEACHGVNIYDTDRHLYSCKAADLMALNRIAEAVPCLEKVQALKGLRGIDTSRLAEGYFAAKQYDKTIALTTDGLKSQPDFLDFNYWRGMAYAATGKNLLAINDLSRFLTRKNSAIEAHSKAHQARLKRAELYKLTGQKTLAQADLDFLKRVQQETYNNTLFRDKRN